MSLFELFVIAVGLSMDAFAVSICKGLSLRKITIKNVLIIAGFFGVFQGAMPLLGYALGIQFRNYIVSIDHWIAFILLLIIGINMIKEARQENEDEFNDALDFKTMIILAIATSIDALAVGITFAFLNVSIIPAVSFIGIITFTLSAIGVKIGNVFGERYKTKAEIAGGIILILMGVKILLEHLNLLPF